MKTKRLILLVLVALSLFAVALPAQASGPTVADVAANGPVDFRPYAEWLGRSGQDQGETQFCALYAAVNEINLRGGIQGRKLDANSLAAQYRAAWPGEWWANNIHIAELLQRYNISPRAFNAVFRQEKWHPDTPYWQYEGQTYGYLIKSLPSVVYPWAGEVFHAVVVTQIRDGWAYFVDSAGARYGRIKWQTLARSMLVDPARDGWVMTWAKR